MRQLRALMTQRRLRWTADRQNRRLRRSAAMSALAVTSLLVGAMSAFVPVQAAQAFDWSGTPMDAGATQALAPTIAAAAVDDVATGYVPLADWTVAGTATTALPGNTAALGDVAAQSGDAGQDLVLGTGGYAVDGVDVPRFLPSSASVTALATDCVDGQPVGQINDCATYPLSVTLPAPVVDPVVALIMGGGGNDSGPDGYCTEGWYDIRVSGVNGAAPAAGSVTALGATGPYEFDGETLAIPQSTVDANTCSAYSAGPIYLQLNGLVSSFSLENLWRAVVVANPGGGAVGGSAIGGMALNVNVPVADLAVAKDAPETAAAGEDITWTIDVTNEGPSDSHGFVVQDAVPAGVTDAALESAPAGCSLDGADLVCAEAPEGCDVAQSEELATWAELSCADPIAAEGVVLASGAAYDTITLTGTAPAESATVSNTATVAGADPDPAEANNTSTVETTVEAGPSPIACSTDGYLFQATDDGYGMFSIDLATGESELVGPYSPSVNAVGYNPLDGFFYAWAATLNDFVRIDADLNVTPLGIGDLRDAAHATMSINTGDIDENGQFFVTGQFTDLPWYQIDLAPGSATYGQVVDQGTRTFPSGVIGAGPDWSWIDGYLYSVTFASTTSTTPQLLRFDPATSQTVNLGALDVTIPVVTGNHLFGATYADADDFLYASHNGSGTILRIDVDTLDTVEFADGPDSTSNDGARCAAAPVPIDFGDAPASYGTSVSDDGARHSVPGYDAGTNTASVMLGEAIDIETDGQSTATADGDDAADAADEDGVTFNPDLDYAEPTLRTGLDPDSQQPLENTLEVAASADGFASVWVDWNQDGDFLDDGEQVADAQAVNAGTNDVSFAQGTNPVGDSVFVRVRYSTDAAAVAAPTGAAPDGEVEDYQVAIDPTSPPAFPCTTDGYLFQGNPVDVYTVDLATGDTNPAAEDIALTNINAIGFHPIDGYLYGWDSSNGTMFRVSSDWGAEDIGLPTNWATVPGLPASMRDGSGINTGDIDEDGHYWVAASDKLGWAEIDLSDPASPTYEQVLAAGTLSLPGQWLAGADWAYNVDDGDLYSVGRILLAPGQNEFGLLRFDTETHATSVVQQYGLLEYPATSDNAGLIAGGFGAVYSDRDGYLYASDNAHGGIWRIDMTTGDRNFFADGRESNTNDAARCYLAAVPIDFGDAPDTYGTTLAADGPRHSIPGYDEGTMTAPVILGSSIDIDIDGQPGTDANGDDLAGVADEDGVVFNPALGYANPTLRTGLDPSSQQPLENTLDVEVSADGFASVWVDWNQDGDFLDDGEQVANAQAVTAGTNQVTFSQGTNPPGTQTFVRVRYSTDAASIATPTGIAPDGEVEDYQVLVERLVVPDSCTVSGVEHYAFTFSAPVDLTGTGGIGSSARYENVTVIGGTPVDMVATVTAGQMFVGPANENGFSAVGDDGIWSIVGAATVRYSFFEAGTETPVDVSAVFTVNDMDSSAANGWQERATFDADDLASYAVSEGSAVSIEESGGQVTFAGNGSWSSTIESRFQVALEGLSSFEVAWAGTVNGSTFLFDGDGDLSIEPPACSDFGDAPDSYGTTLASDGARHQIVPGVTLGDAIDVDADGQPGTDANGDDLSLLADEDGVVFNPDLGYPEPTLRTGTDPNSLGAVENTLQVETSADGFVSVWVDWNQDGDFADDGEQVVAAEAVVAGQNELTFAQGENPNGIRTYVRVRYSTDAESIATPTGDAPDGEVEDYRVLLERLTAPDTCTASGVEHSAFTFGTPVDQVGDGTEGSSARYQNVTVVNGVAVDMIAEVVAGELVASSTAPSGFRHGSGGVIGVDDAQWQVNRDATIRYSFVVAGTDTPVEVNAVFTVNDMDGDAQGETATFAASDLTSYGVATGSAVSITENGNDVVFVGSGTWDGDDESRFQFVIEGLSTFETQWHGGANSGFGFDGDGDLSIDPPACSDFGDAPDSYGTTIDADGAQHQITPGLTLGAEVDFDPDGQPSDDATGDGANRLADEDGVSDPIVAIVGDETIVIVSATNDTDEPATLAGWIDLDASGTFDEGERYVVSVPANSGTADYEMTFPAGTVTGDSFARFRLFAGDVADPAPTGAVIGGEVEDYAVTMIDRRLDIEKTSDMTPESRVGDTVTFTVTAVNSGTADYTEEFPAVIFDDLSGVLDDATYAGGADAVASDGSEIDAPSFIPDSFLSWSGPIAVGESVTITYQVTLTSGGDGNVRNVAWPPNDPPDPGDPPTDIPTCDPPTEDGTDPVTGEACGFTEGLLPRLTIEKVADTEDLPADGGTVTYTVTVRNEGPGVYTTDAPASMTDDLSAVLDDGTFGEIVSPADGSAVRDGDQITWSGPLAAEESVQIVYTVAYDADAVAGDHLLVNTACVPEDEALDPDAACDLVQVPAAALTMDKTVDPEDGSIVVPGQEVTYTLSFTNTGEAPAEVNALDTLTDVLDDATLTGAPVADDGLVATVDADRLTVTGEVPVGATLTVTYTVTVNAYAEQGDHRLGNVLSDIDGTCPPGGCPDTENPVRHYTVAKAVETDEDEPVNPGDVVTYTVTIVNDGEADYTVGEPASISDDLSAVLDDAAYNGDAAAVVVGDDEVLLPAPAVSDDTLTWSGAIAIGQTVTITYSVTVNDPASGDGELTNAVIPTGDGGDCVPDECRTVTPVQSYTVSKAASATTLVPGDTLTYTVTVTNTSDVDYTADAPASFTDDLSEVLDDAAYNDDATNGATVDGDILSWSGPLLADQTIVITYSVKVNDPTTGDDILTNAVVPTGPGGDCVPDECETTTPVQSYTVAKEVSQITAEPGDTVTYTVTVTNTGQVGYTAADPASFTDDLSAVLDDATYNDDASNGATVEGDVLSWSGELAIGAEITITYSVEVNDPNSGDGELTNAVVPTGSGGDCDPLSDCETTTGVQSYTVTKVASEETVQPGDTVSYEITVRNTGTVDYTAQEPASFTDDLSEVLDDAMYLDDATGGATVTGSILSWSGALPAGESVTVSYSVRVNDPNTGDNLLTNAAVPTGPGGSCDPDGECETVTPVQSFRVTKTGDAVEVVPGDVITYTLQIANTGAAPYTTDDPASLTDDLSQVLDDAAYNDDATNGATYDAPVLSWSGPLAVGETVTVTYSVTVDDPVTGDSQIDNAVVTVNGGNCPEGSTDPACSTNIPAGSFTVAKAVSAESAMAGDVVTYTVTVTNTGQVDYTDEEPASFQDNLANVLDDATYNDDASGGATVDGTTLSWSGPLAVDETVEITYSVTVDDAGTGAGDLSLDNIVTPSSPGGECDPDGECATVTPIGRFHLSKTSSGAGEVLAGDVVSYTVTVVNDSEVDFTADEPASFTDDLSAVLDDAEYNDDATNGASVDGAILSWTGPLSVGESIDIVYTVTVLAAGSGDGELTNGVVPGDGGTCIGACSTVDRLRAFTVTKTSSAAGEVNAGDVVTYTVRVANTGALDYTETIPASFDDDLSAVLDDAAYNADVSGGAEVVGQTLSWTGPLAVGERIDITYSVTVLPAGSGDGVLTNAAVPVGPGGDCDPDEDCTTTNEVQAFTVSKQASRTVVSPGDVVTYTITVANTGAAAYTADDPAVVHDDMTEVLDDAAYNGDATNGASYTEPMLTWELALAPGEKVTVTYSVTVDDPATGDLHLRNAAIPGTGGECTDEASCFTVTPVASYSVAKTVDSSTSAPGDTVTYTVTVTNTGAVPYTDEDPASFTDDLSAVLDDAEFDGEASGGATYAEPVLSWAGPLEVGASHTVSYSVVVADPARGDGELLNGVVPGEGGDCGDACTTTTDVEVPGDPALPATGLGPWVLGAAGAAFAALLAGLVLYLTGRRRRISE